MCWIFAYNWKENAIPLLVEGLRNLEYRGYDSAGVFGITSWWKIFLEKAVWKVTNLATKVEKNNLKDWNYNCWIAHTRWATHWGVTVNNTHPHFSTSKRFFVVHNGIIENYRQLKATLENNGHVFYSDTDTEVVAKLMEEMFTWNLLETVEIVTKKLVWAYALWVVDSENPGVLVGAKLGSPMIVWIWEWWVFLSSDINAVSKVADEFISLEDYEIVKLENGKHSIFSSWKEVNREGEKIGDNFQTAEMWDYETFTDKEISEIPDVIRNVFRWRVDFEHNIIKSSTLERLNEYDIERVEIIWNGSSYFAWMSAQWWFRSLAWIPCEVRQWSEFLYETFLPDQKCLYIFMSQSWETADIRESVKMVKSKWCLTFWVVNVVWTTVARECDMWLFSRSWVEVWVASTKNIVWQLWVLILMSISMWLKRDLQTVEAHEILDKLSELPSKLESQLQDLSQTNKLIEKYSQFTNFFFLGRNLLHWTACECSLKFKELTQIHSEAYSTWELKHWALALIDKKMPTIALNLKGLFRSKNESNVQEVKARWWIVLWVITVGDKNKELYDDTIEVPAVHPVLSPFMPLIPLWSLSVWVAKVLWKDVDKPQNLAKSVTVE